MKKSLLAFVATVLAAASLSASDFPAGSPKFGTNYEAVLKAAKSSGKPAVVVFSASWCGPCQAMKKDVYPSAEVKPLQDKFNWAYLDIDQEPNGKLSDDFKIEGIPHILFLNAEGKIIDRQEGGSSPEEFSKKLTEVLKKAEAK